MAETLTPQVWIDRLEKTLEAFDEAGGHRCLRELFEHLPAENALTEVVLPYLRAVGDRWNAGIIGVGQEHFASNVIRLHLAARMQEETRDEGPLALLACAPGEQHEFGLMAFAVTLSRRGWRIVYLGANTPAPELVRVTSRLSPDIVVVAAHRPTAIAAHAGLLRHMGQSSRVYVAAADGGDDLGRLCEAVHLDGDPVASAFVVDERERSEAETPVAG